MVLGIGALSMLICALSISKDTSAMLGLKGYIEIVTDSGIRRISFIDGKNVEILKKEPDCLVRDFDVSPDGKNRVIAAEGVGYEHTRLLLYSPDKKLIPLSDKGCVKPAYSPDGEYVAFLSTMNNIIDVELERAKRNVYLYLSKVDTTNLDKTRQQVSKLPLDDYRPSWFPDSQRLAVSTDDLKIFIVNIKNSVETKIIDFGQAPTVSHDGEKIAYLSNEVDAETKRKIIDYRNMSQKLFQEIIAEKGARQKELINLDQYNLKHAIYIYNIATHEKKRLSDAIWVEQPVIWSPDDSYLLYNDRAAVSNDIYVINVNSGKKDMVTSETGRVMTWKLQ